MANQNEASCSKSTHSCFLPHDPPYLAVITEPDACDSKERMDATIQAITSAVSTGKVALVSIRVVQPKNIASSQVFEERVVELTTALVSLAVEHAFHVVVTSDWVGAAIKACAHGIHVKEHHCSRIPVIQQCFQPRIPLIGTSAHSISSALKATSMYQPDYLFVGTCYTTASHPEKMGLEGPQLPGRICRELEGKDRPVIFAIGGIDEENCAEPVVKYGSDGVAAIRSILQSSDPAKSVEAIMKNMKKE
jgi:thiamine-phosphate diphosphorylase